LRNPAESGRKIGPKQREIAFDPARAANHHVVGAGHAASRQQLAGEGAKAPLHAIADYGAADLLGHGKADADAWIVVLAVADQQDEARRGGPPAAVGSQEIRAFRKCD